MLRSLFFPCVPPPHPPLSTVVVVPFSPLQSAGPSCAVDHVEKLFRRPSRFCSFSQVSPTALRLPRSPFFKLVFFPLLPSFPLEVCVLPSEIPTDPFYSRRPAYRFMILTIVFSRQDDTSCACPNFLASASLLPHFFPSHNPPPHHRPPLFFCEGPPFLPFSFALKPGLRT